MSVGDVLHGGPVTERDYDLLTSKLYFHTHGTRDPYVRYTVLLALSVIIATGGVIADSTAAVIGAMIIAPLMIPIMATALAVVTGDPRVLARSLLLVLAGGGGAVLLAFALGAAISAGVIDPATNTQITSRVHPRLIDLLMALATGAVGAFALGRENVADTLPGVAIAISLVPPLAVVGVSLAIGDTESAGGAGLLFLTNVTAILVAGGGVLAIMGYGRVALGSEAMVREGRRSRRVAAACIAGAALVLAVPLAHTTRVVVRDAALEREASDRVDELVEGTGLEIQSITARNAEVEVVLLDDVDGDLEVDVELMRDELRSVRDDVQVTVRIIPERVLRSGER